MAGRREEGKGAGIPDEVRWYNNARERACARGAHTNEGRFKKTLLKNQVSLLVVGECR